MKYLDLKTVVSAYNGCYNKTKNQFWGLLAILKAVNSKISPINSYRFNGADVSKFLDSLFCPNAGIGDYRTDYYYVIFSTEWLERLPSLMLKETPNIWDVCAWYFRNRSFDDKISPDDLIDIFFEEIHLTREETKTWFNYDKKTIDFYSLRYFDSELLKNLEELGVVYPQNGSLSFDKKTGLTSKAGQLTAANFVQSLYSALSVEECLILSKFDFGSLYNTKPSIMETRPSSNGHLQLIFYGAPGTGKSHKVNRDTKGEAVVRTTFHPDSDYSTFVGAYKPKMGKGKVYGAQGPLQKNGQDIEEPKIIYEFVCQAFLKAYLAAWEKYSKYSENPKPQYLVIEEINRGNCAQIFGDIFQLLDRSTNGFSKYPIEADSDLQAIISQKFKEDRGLYKLDENFDIDHLIENYTSNYGESRTLTDDIRDGYVLLLPKNLYIWATMNTSDQSLFPIDSAFKRRWDWQYMPITYKDNGWYISVDEYKYEWVTFLRKINKLIGETTHSEDKKLGDYFCKPMDKEIDSNIFVSKVIFYLWNDVFKDYEFANSVFDDIDGKKLTFDKFYTTINSEAVVVEDKVVMFLNKLDEAIDKEHSMLRQKGSPEGGIQGNDFTNYTFNDSKPIGKSALGLTVMMEYLNGKPLTFDEIKTTFPDAMLGNVSHKGLIVKDDVDLGSYSRYYAQGFISSDGIKYKIYKQWTVSNIQNIIDFAFSQGWKVEEKGSWKRKDNNA